MIAFLACVVALALPGWLGARLLTDGDPLWTGAMAAALAILGVPALAFGVGLALRASVTVPLLVATGLLTSLALVGLGRLRARE